MKNVTKEMVSVSVVAALLLSSAGVAATFNGNLKADIFTVRENAETRWFESNEVDATPRMSSVKVVTSSGHSLAAGYWNEDDYMDLIIGRPDRIMWFRSDNTETGTANVNWNFSSNGAKPNGLALGDYLGDGTQQLYAVQMNGELRRFTVTGTSISSSVLTSGANAVAVGDFDGSGVMDMFFSKQEGVVWTNINGKYETLTAYGDAKGIRVGDFDGDGFGDMFIVRADGYIDWLKSSGIAHASPTFVKTFGDGLAQTLSFGDITGDGVAEMLVGRDGAGLVWYRPDGYGDLSVISGEFGYYNSITDIVIVPVPEPATLVMLGLGGMALAIKKRKY